MTRLVVGVLLLAATGCGRVGGQPYQPTLNTPLAVEAGRTVGQTFDPVGPVAAIDVSVATFAMPADAEGVLQAVLRGSGGDRSSATAEVTGASLQDGTWAALRFEQPVEVEGQAVLEISWQGATPLALWANRTLEGTEGIVNDPYPEGQLVLDGQPVEGDLAFRVIGPGGVDAAPEQLGDVTASAARRFAEQPRFAIAWALALSGCVVLAVGTLRRPRQ